MFSTSRCTMLPLSHLWFKLTSNLHHSHDSQNPLPAVYSKTAHERSPQGITRMVRLALLLPSRYRRASSLQTPQAAAAFRPCERGSTPRAKTWRAAWASSCCFQQRKHPAQLRYCTSPFAKPQPWPRPPTALPFTASPKHILDKRVLAFLH